MAALHSTTVRYWSAGLRIVTILFLALSAFGPAQAIPVYAADTLQCGVPGKDGPATSLIGVVNTYYPGTANVAAGSNSIPVGIPSGAAATIQPGDLLLVIQMQGADINSTNTGAYGDGTGGNPATGNLTTNFSAGLYEYVVATSAVSGGAVSISSGLDNNYFDQDYPVGAGNQGQRRFQVIRVPQYSSATLTGTVTALTWNGSVGGVVALDVAGTLNLGGNTIDVSGRGFRGGGGIRYRGGTGVFTDYRTLSTNTANASKGEGTAGTPRFIYTGATVIDEGINQEGYPDGSFARGAPGNAGGGGTDGNPPNNDQNTGGGGGGNGGTGGHGGTAWDNDLADSGGFGGDDFQASPTRLVMGGGGGAGSIDDNEGVLSSGAAGGGIAMVFAGTVTGNGTINANGLNAPGQLLNDSGGGGGAGGSVVVMAQNGALPAGLNISANGGRGGDAWPGQPPGAEYPGTRHGPGGGGGGGVIYHSAGAGTLSVTGGQNGITTTANDNYLSTPGAPGIIDTVPTNTIPPIGATCIPTPLVVKTTSTPLVTQTPSGTTGEYTITVSIPADQGTALGFTISDTLPAGFTYASTTAINLSGGATRTATNNPTAGTSIPAWGTFDIPGGGAVAITFTVNIASTVPPGTYQNPATATFLDPTRTVTTGTATVEYDITDPGEDITIGPSLTLPDLTVTKTNNVNGTVTQGSPFNWTIAVANSGGAPATFASGQVVMRDALPGAASYYPQGNLVVNPAGAIGCTIANTTLTCTTNAIYTLAAGSSFSVNFQVTPAAVGNLANTAVVDPDEVMPESNENNNTASNTVAVTVPGGPTADLSVVKTNGQIIYRPGSVVTYTVTVTNLNGDPADGATVTDNKPANITTWAWVCTTQSGGATGCDPAADSANNFTDTVNLPVGGTIVYTVTANVSANATGALVNTANIAVPEGITDPDPSNNSSTDRDELNAADLLLIKAPATKKVDIGDTLTFTITLTNLGPDDAFDVEVTDKLPSAFTYISSIPSKGTYDSATGVWAVGDMPLNAKETLQITVKVNDAGTNVAEVTQSLAGPDGPPLIDPNPDNNLSESKITIKKDDDPTPKPNPYIIPVTGFQQGVVTDLSRVPHEVYLATADVTVEIPSLGVKIPIVGVPKKDGTWNVAWLENQAGWLEGSAFPSWNGNSVLTSHVYLASGKPGPFVNLNKLKFGDKIVVHAYGQKYTFEVQTNTVVPPTDKSMMKHEEKPWLTLVTCKDYDPKTNTYLNRVLVRARLVSVDWE